MSVIMTISVIVTAFVLLWTVVLSSSIALSRVFKKKWQTKHSLSTLAICLVVYVVGFGLFGLKLNFSPSAPIGIYQKSNSAFLQTGDLVEYCIDNPQYIRLAANREYLSKGSCSSGLKPVLKEVAGLPGDKVVISPDNQIYINGEILKHSEIRSKDLKGRVMPKTELTAGIIPAGRLFLFSDHIGGFDSRYFGLVEQSKVKKYKTLIVFKPWGASK